MKKSIICNLFVIYEFVIYFSSGKQRHKYPAFIVTIRRPGNSFNLSMVIKLRQGRIRTHNMVHSLGLSKCLVNLIIIKSTGEVTF